MHSIGNFLAFTIQQTLLKSQYQPLIFKLEIGRLNNLFVLILSFLMAVSLVLDFFGLVNISSDQLSVHLILASLFVLLPLYIWLKAGKNYSLDKKIHSEHRFEFSQEGIRFISEVYSYQCSWSFVNSTSLTKNYFIIYDNFSILCIVKREMLSDDQLTLIKRKIFNEAIQALNKPNNRDKN